MKAGWPVVGSLAAGAVLALEITVNGGLGAAVRPVTAAAFSNVLSLVIVLAVAPLLPGLSRAFGELRTALRLRTLRPWHCLGGVAGGAMVLTQATAVDRLGAALYTLALVAGQTAAGVVVDRVGLGPGSPQAITARRVAGAVLTVVAVVPPVFGATGPGDAAWLVLLPLAAGAGLAFQLAVNGRVDEAVRSPYPSVLMSFIAGVVVLGTAAVVDFAAHGVPSGWPDEPVLYAGGVFGAVFVLSSVLLVRRSGVLIAALGMIAGQVVGSVVIDVAVGRTAGTTQFVVVVLCSALLLASVLIVSGKPKETAHVVWSRDDERSAPSAGLDDPRPADPVGGPDLRP
ncbi:transporter family-2 protein [Saccharothrix saharensis]|uniref:Transporter family-2 protein n=1 Tax=Saccharothrix saharensis TaxID=571190 RepID=A0A543JR91_9PSEU|nr:DMT family transporter [Saccharothrix saharensis]TQM85366.1 transporter family-2 protein [Saccharothrix saharensis]